MSAPLAPPCMHHAQHQPTALPPTALHCTSVGVSRPCPLPCRAACPQGPLPRHAAMPRHTPPWPWPRACALARDHSRLAMPHAACPSLPAGQVRSGCGRPSARVHAKVCMARATARRGGRRVGRGWYMGGGGARRGHGAGAGAGRTGAQGRWGRAAQSRGRRRRNGAAGEAEAGGGLHHEGTRQGSVAGPWVKHASAAMRHAAARPLRPCHAKQGSRSWGQRRLWPEPLGKPYVHAKDLPKNRKTAR